MLTRFKRCCCWLPGITNRSRNQLHIRTDFFFLRSSSSLLPTATQHTDACVGYLDWTRETVKCLPRSLPRRPPEFSAILSRAARGVQAGAPAGRPATASTQPPDGNPPGACSGDGWGLGVGEPRPRRLKVQHARALPFRFPTPGRARARAWRAALESQGG